MFFSSHAPYECTVSLPYINCNLKESEKRTIHGNNFFFFLKSYIQSFLSPCIYDFLSVSNRNIVFFFLNKVIAVYMYMHMYVIRDWSLITGRGGATNGRGGGDAHEV